MKMITFQYIPTWILWSVWDWEIISRDRGFGFLVSSEFDFVENMEYLSSFKYPFKDCTQTVYFFSPSLLEWTDLVTVQVVNSDVFDICMRFIG
jgi:hypothetical protein